MFFKVCRIPSKCTYKETLAFSLFQSLSAAGRVFSFLSHKQNITLPFVIFKQLKSLCSIRFQVPCDDKKIHKKSVSKIYLPHRTSHNCNLLTCLHSSFSHYYSVRYGCSGCVPANWKADKRESLFSFSNLISAWWHEYMKYRTFL